jgi:molybdenum cofactor cytidylyltransferase
MKYAVLPAAGKSSRMGRPKLTLPLGDRTILEHVLAALHQADVPHILVVTGPHGDELAALALRAGVQVHQLAEETSGMRATVEHGLRWLEERYQPRAEDTWLLVPADHPTLTPAIVCEVKRASRIYPAHSIFVPTFQGRRGHPLALCWRHVAAIRAHPVGEGLNTYVRQHVAETMEVPVDTEAVLWDLDTPEDYERLRRSWSSAR